MGFLLVILYTAIFSLIIFGARFFHDERLPKVFFIAIFLTKVVTGILYTYTLWGGDTNMYFNDANVNLYPTLWHNPLKYLYLVFGPNGGNIPEFIYSQVKAMGYWGDTSAYMVVRFNALVRLFSFGNIYVHAVFMAFVSLLGLTWLYKAFAKSNGNNIYSIAAIFLIPSVLFWGSGVHKEGLLLFALGLFFYGAVSLSEEFNWKILSAFLTGAFFVFLVRDFVFLLLFPGIIAFFVSRKNERAARFIFPLAYILLLLAGCFLPVFKGNNLLQIIAYKQQQFLAISAGSTQIDVHLFLPHFISLITNLPQALRNSILGPFLISPDSFSHFMVMIENAFLLLAAFALPFITGKPRFSSLNIWFLVFSITLFILIGYIVPNVGAIVRYRSLALPFIFFFLASGRKNQDLSFEK